MKPVRYRSRSHDLCPFALASLCNLDQLPATGAIVFTAPLKIVDGSGSPLPVLTLVEGSGERRTARGADYRGAMSASNGP